MHGCQDRIYDGILRKKALQYFFFSIFLMLKVWDDVYFYTSLCRTAPIKGSYYYNACNMILASAMTHWSLEQITGFKSTDSKSFSSSTIKSEKLTIKRVNLSIFIPALPRYPNMSSFAFNDSTIERTSSGLSGAIRIAVSL